MRRFNSGIFIDHSDFRKPSVISFPERIIPHLRGNIMFHIITSIFNSFTFLLSLIVNITLIYYTYAINMEFYGAFWDHRVCFCWFICFPTLFNYNMLLVLFISSFRLGCWVWWIVGLGFRWFGIILNCSHSFEISFNLLLRHHFFKLRSHSLPY